MTGSVVRSLRGRRREVVRRLITFTFLVLFSSEFEWVSTLYWFECLKMMFGRVSSRSRMAMGSRRPYMIN